MTTTRPRSQLAGFLISVPAAFAVWLVTLYYYVHITEGPVQAAGVTVYAIIGGVLFGLPILVGLVVLVAFPLSIALRRTIGVTLPLTVVLGAACGVLVRVVVERLWGVPEILFLPWPVVLITGGATGWVWWRVTQRDDSPSRSMSAR